MPFVDDLYEGIFCYALVHLLNTRQRKVFLEARFSQLKPGGIMMYIVASKETGLYGHGRWLSKDRFEIARGLKVFFYDPESVLKEFSKFGRIEYMNIEEPVKFMEGEKPVKMIQVTCSKDIE